MQVPASGPAARAVPLAVVEYYVLADQAVAFIVRPDRDEPIVERLPVSGESTRAAALRLVDDMAPRNINPVHPEWSADLSYLDPIARALLDPVWQHLDGVESICIVPHGHLFYLPFHALRLASGRHVVEDRPIVYSPSAALLMNARLQRRLSKPRRFVGFGTGMADDPPARRHAFEEEVSGLSALPVWTDRRALTGAAASAAAFLAAGRGADVVHCACHGHFDAGDPLSSGLLLSDGEQMPLLTADADTRAPFLLSARTIAAASIPADLVYLSACVTGRHDIRPGDEILGLVRAFIRAGAASIVASLWPVAAWSSTRQLMETFYTRWLVDGMSKAKAMQAAQLETMAQHPHPYHWAPFSLVGDWQ